ncbi:DUF7301 family protein [Enterobacter ludwigii]|uniref:DUF7301 family protein n=2 Tax=Enterobacter ludwigii TaxID=299767 RepID=UPI003C2CB827
MTTANQLLQADMAEANQIHKRYWESSSLPQLERFTNRPSQRKYPRDRVLYRLLQIDLEAISKRMMGK